jgi:hypothetical protein
MPRFTLSFHAGGKEEDHFDLLLEQGDTLKTWRLKSVNFSPPQPATAIKDHKKTYLDFEVGSSSRRARRRPTRPRGPSPTPPPGSGRPPPRSCAARPSTPRPPPSSTRCGRPCPPKSAA